MPNSVMHAKAEIQRPSAHVYRVKPVCRTAAERVAVGGVWLMLRPDFVAVVLLYWCMHKPWRVGIGLSWQ